MFSISSKSGLRVRARRDLIKNKVLSKSNKSVLVKNHLINSDKNFVIPHAVRVHGLLALLFTLKITCSWSKKKKINYPEWGELRKYFISVACLFNWLPFQSFWLIYEVKILSCFWWGRSVAFLHDFGIWICSCVWQPGEDPGRNDRSA